MASLDDLAREVRGFVADTGAGASPPDDEAFGRLALRVFAMQFEHNRPYRAFCERRGVQPDRIDGWSAIPAVPTSAFRSLDLGCAPTETVFLTSGTTEGTERRGRHPVPRPEVYREAAIAHFRRMVLPDGARPRLVALLGTFSGRILINRTLGEAARVQDCFILADKVHVLRRPVATQGRGVFILNDPRECLGMLGRFEEIWGSSEPGVSANSTGL